MALDKLNTRFRAYRELLRIVWNFGVRDSADDRYFSEVTSALFADMVVSELTRPNASPWPRTNEPFAGIGVSFSGHSYLQATNEPAAVRWNERAGIPPDGLRYVELFDFYGGPSDKDEWREFKYVLAEVSAPGEKGRVRVLLDVDYVRLIDLTVK